MQTSINNDNNNKLYEEMKTDGNLDKNIPFNFSL